MSIFQKKIYIGSIVGVIATAVGTIAVFFPSMFNLETQKIKTYEALITKREQTNEFYSFLKNEIKENSIFKLDVSICSNQDLFTEDYVNLAKFVPPDELPVINIFNKHETLTNIVDPIYLRSINNTTGYHEHPESIGLFEITQKADPNEMYGGSANYYYLPNEFSAIDIYPAYGLSERYYWDNIDFPCELVEEGEGTKVIVKINGYFTFKKELSPEEFEFQAINEKELKLKSY